MMVNTRMSERAKQALGLAEREAATTGAAGLDVGHMLLGLLDEERLSEGTSGLLSIEGIDRDAVRRTLARTENGTDGPAEDGASRTFTPAAKAVIDRAAGVSDEVLDFRIGVRHLLVGALADRDGPAATALHEHGVDVDRLAGHARARLADDDSPRPAAGLDPVLQQLTVVVGMLGRISARLDRIEARLRGERDDGPVGTG